MHFNARLWPLGLVFLGSTTFAECGPEPDEFESWPENLAVPVESIPLENWFRSSGGWIISPDRCQAVGAAWEREAAFEAFQRHFGRTPMPGSIVDVKHANAFASIRAAGAAWVLPWRFTIEAGRGTEVDPRSNAIRQQIQSQLSSGGRTPEPEQVEQLVRSAISQLTPVVESAKSSLEPKALRHEVAHMLFIHGVWPSSQAAGAQYGGDAPDWLDEAAAIAAESGEMTAARRSLFLNAARDGQLIPLDRYLSMPHPVFGGNDFRDLMREAREAAARDGAVVHTASMNEDQITEARIFYAQTRAWLDFLHELTGIPGILGEVTDALRNGQSLQDWLRQDGSNVGLPQSLEALQTAFQSWALMLQSPDSKRS